MADFEILIGDCIERMRELPEQSIHTCVTSPPYFGLRDYGVNGQIGLEETPEDFVAKMVEVFREVHRVLRDDGTLWLNLGDTYASTGGPGWQGKSGDRSDRRFTGSRNAVAMRQRSRTTLSGYKPKDLIGVPWMVAFALRSDGWYLRQEIIWNKSNPMPESVSDRCTKSHEQIFLLTKSPRYYFDAEAIKEPASPKSNPRASKSTIEAVRKARSEGGNTSQGQPRESQKVHPVDGMVRANSSFENALCVPVTERNKRSVWTVSTSPYSGAHFATFPLKLIEPCILAGAPHGGIVLDPFGGAGTTALAALKHGRRAILCELNPEYAEMARSRIAAPLQKALI